MIIKSVEQSIIFNIETDEGNYVRSEGGTWQKYYGDSLECCYSDEEQLEAAYQEYINSNIVSHEAIRVGSKVVETVMSDFAPNEILTVIEIKEDWFSLCEDEGGHWGWMQRHEI